MSQPEFFVIPGQFRSFSGGIEPGIYYSCQTNWEIPGYFCLFLLQKSPE